MIEKIEEKIKLETEKIVNKENLNIEEINFLITEKRRLEYEKTKEEKDIERQKALEVLLKSGFGSNPY